MHRIRRLWRPLAAILAYAAAFYLHGHVGAAAYVTSARRERRAFELGCPAASGLCIRPLPYGWSADYSLGSIGPPLSDTAPQTNLEYSVALISPLTVSTWPDVT
jgi:hypothetical protein